MLDDQHTTGAENLDAVFKAYDVRGLVGDQIDESLARAVGAAFVAETGARRLVVGHDMRESSPSLAGAFGDGATEAGADVVMIGLASTDQLYFASGHLELPGVMFTASHNPAATRSRIAPRPDSLPIGDAPARHILIPLYAAGLWLAVNITPGRSKCPEAK